MRLFRGMRQDADQLPTVGAEAKMLGVRPGVDIPVIDGTVQPRTGGMSVVHPDPKFLPSHLRPVKLGGKSRHPVFHIESDVLPGTLFVKPDGRRHYVIEPAATCLLNDYQLELGSTRGYWVKLAL